jgi:hypothetical protein
LSFLLRLAIHSDRRALLVDGWWSKPRTVRGSRNSYARARARAASSNSATSASLVFVDPDDRARVAQGDVLALRGLHAALVSGAPIEIANTTRGTSFRARHDLSPREVEIVRAGGLIAVVRARIHHAA